MNKINKTKITYYYLVNESGKHYLGSVEILNENMDSDDAFPVFHLQVFPDEHYFFLQKEIREGAYLIAESNHESKRIFLAYVLGNEDYWYGHKSTLEYFNINFKFAS